MNPAITLVFMLTVLPISVPNTSECAGCVGCDRYTMPVKALSIDLWSKERSANSNEWRWRLPKQCTLADRVGDARVESESDIRPWRQYRPDRRICVRANRNILPRRLTTLITSTKSTIPNDFEPEYEDQGTIADAARLESLSSEMPLLSNQSPITENMPSIVYDADLPPLELFPKLGNILNGSGDLFRNSDCKSGLIRVVLGEDPYLQRITNAKDLRILINDNLNLVVTKGGKPNGYRIRTDELNVMLGSKHFLKSFRPLDRLITEPHYLSTWELTGLGYTDGGPGQRFFQIRAEVPIFKEPESICRFLDVMQFKTNADRTNTVAAALTVILRNHFPGGKPFFPVTANRSHAGKGTVVEFISGHCVNENVTYEKADWAFQKSIVYVFREKPDVGVINIDNIRLDRPRDVIGSAFLERVLHEREPLLSSPGVGEFQVRGHFVVTATVNEGKFSPDLINRSVAIRLESRGDLMHRKSVIGDPKGEFLPQNRDRIAGELRGMIERWKEAGQPLDENVRHPSFPEWARVIGGILKVAGFNDFMANQLERRTDDDPVRVALALLGQTHRDRWKTTSEWADLIGAQGLTKALIGAADRESPEGRRRGTGVVLARHTGETLEFKTEDAMLKMNLESSRRRHNGEEAKTRYRFKTIDLTPIPEDASVSME